MTYRLAIFDFDGTLADSFPFFLSVFNTIADLHGFRRIDIGNSAHLRSSTASPGRCAFCTRRA
jgi:phosphoglycolate phosphatase